MTGQRITWEEIADAYETAARSATVRGEHEDACHAAGCAGEVRSMADDGMELDQWLARYMVPDGML